MCMCMFKRETVAEAGNRTDIVHIPALSPFLTGRTFVRRTYCDQFDEL